MVRGSGGPISKLDFVEVVNEPLHDPPAKDDEGGGNYIQALGGSGASGWDWVLESFRLGRKYFPNSLLMINDYSITDNDIDTGRYLAIIELLAKEKLVDAIGVQGHAFATTAKTAMSVHRSQPGSPGGHRLADLRNRTRHRRSRR